MCAAPDCPFEHHAPAFVEAVHVGCGRYNDWLSHQAESCRRRDRAWDKRPDLPVYKQAIHRRVVRSEGLDFYTGLAIRWDLLNHERKVTPGRSAHRRRGRYPSVDHYNGLHSLDYRICTGLVNHAKGPMPHREFVELCRNVVRQEERRLAQPMTESRHAAPSP